MLFNIFS